MRSIVSKFGGSSTANAECFENILNIVKDNPARRCIVLSAPGVDGRHGEKVTGLLETLRKRKARGQPVDMLLKGIVDRFEGIARALGVAGFAEIAEAEIRAALTGSRARLLSRGEALCARLFSMWSGIAFVDAAQVIAFTTDGALDERETARRIRRATEAEDRVVIPGFYGSDPHGRIVTFPRNGSDITGALVAAATGAALYENWSDVPGLMTADPVIVPNAKLIPQVGYRQMRMLARAGAQVLHPACLDPVAMAGIPTRLRCTFDPDSFGTLIDERFSRIAPCVAAQRSARLPDESGVAACACVMGLDPREHAGAIESVRPLAHTATEECLRCYVPPERLKAAVQTLHDIVTA